MGAREEEEAEENEAPGAAGLRQDDAGDVDKSGSVENSAAQRNTKMMYYYYAAKWGTPAVLKVSAATRNLFSWDAWTNGRGRSPHINDCLGVVRSLPFAFGLRIFRGKMVEYCGDSVYVGEVAESLPI